MLKLCMARGLSTELYVPVVTTILKQMIVGLRFPGLISDDLTTGCQQFLVAYAGKSHHLQVTAASSVANQLAQGDQNASLADIRTICKRERSGSRTTSRRYVSPFSSMRYYARAFFKVSAPHTRLWKRCGAQLWGCKTSPPS
jgi:hypothetical protein